MPLDFFDNMVSYDVIQPPCEYYHDLQQAFINDQWDNTSAVKIIQEQDMTDSGDYVGLNFHKTEAWMNYVVGQTSTMRKNGDDFAQLTFKCLEHPCVRGRYYKFDDNYWLSDFTDEYDSVVKTLTVRRCNNVLRMVDPENGGIFAIPCVVEYNMMAPNVQVSRSVITPNNHASVIVQANPDTLRLFKINTRFILGGRPFKLYAWQNALLDDASTPKPELFYLDLFLDEIHANDDIEKQIAFNGKYDYKVIITNGDMKLAKGTKGKINTVVTLNGEQVDRKVRLVDNNGNAIKIDDDGNFSIIGTTSEVQVSAELVGNPKVHDTITIQIADEPIIHNPVVFMYPSFDKIRESETLTVELKTMYKGIEYNPIVSDISLNEANKNIEIVSKGNNLYDIICLHRSQDPVTLNLTAENKVPDFIANNQVRIKLVNIFG